MPNNISENNRRIAKNTVLLYTRMLLTMGVALYTSRIVLQTLGIVDYGLYNVVGGIVAMFTFLNGAMAGATQRFLNYALGENDVEKLRLIFSTSVFVHAAIAMIIFLLAETLGLWFLYNELVIPENRMDAAFWVYQCSILSCIIMIMSAPYNAVIIARERMGAFAYISILEVVLKLVIVYLLTAFDIDKLMFYAILILLVQVSIRLVYQIYCNKYFYESKILFVFNKKIFSEMGSFAGWNLLGNFAIIGLTQGLNILLNIFFGPTVNAARGIAVQVQQAINGFSSNFQTAINPQITKSYASQDVVYMHSLIIRSAKFSFIVLFLLSLPVLIETNQILNIWLKNVPSYSVSFIRLILFISLLDAMANSVSTAINAVGRIKVYQITIGVILLMVVPISYLFLKLGFHPEIVFIVYACVNLLGQIVRLFFAKRIVKIRIKDFVVKVYLKVILVSFSSMIIPICISYLMSPSIVRLLLVSCISFVSTGFSIYYIGLDLSERQLIKNIIINKLNYRKR